MRNTSEQFTSSEIMTKQVNWSTDQDSPTGSVGEIELESWSYVQHKHYQLHLLQRSEKAPDSRPVIPVSEAERLSYYSGYTTSPFKLQIIYLQQLNFSTFFWMYVGNVLLRSLPTNYLHVFLAAYYPNEHLFGAKMLPLCFGVSVQIVVCALMQLVCSADSLAMFFNYALYGFLYQSPWDRCEQAWYQHEPNPVAYHCLSIDQFLNITRNSKFFLKVNESTDLTFAINFYYLIKANTSLPRKTWFTGAPLSYFMRLWLKMSVIKYREVDFVIFFTIIWVSVGLFYKQLYRKYIWKMMNYFQQLENCVYLLSALFIIRASLESDMGTDQIQQPKQYLELAQGWDYDMQAESITGPPVVHLLTSRSSELQTINPGRDSIIITASNALMYLFKGLVNYKLKAYVESIVKVPLLISFLNPYPVFYFWPFFFHNIIFGMFLMRIFYLMTFVAEFMIFMLTYQILIEVFVCEWQWMKRWMATVVFSSVGLVLCCLLQYEVKCNLYIFSTAITSMTEAIMICWLYPLGRLFDDMHFQFGTPVIILRKWSLRIMPFYYVYKVYRLFRTTQRGRLKSDQQRIMSDWSSSRWTWIVSVVPLALGALYAIFTTIRRKQNWRVLVRPLPTFGPREHVTRQLRKLFDSREYIGSQASRYLSRHLLAKAQTPTYRLDLRYDRRSMVRRSTEDKTKLEDQLADMKEVHHEL